MCSRRLSKPKNESTPLLDADREKSAIQSHPLFPLLEHLFFKCEYSTSNLNSSNTKVDVDEMLAMIADKGPETNGDQSPGGLGSGPSWRTRDEELDQLVRRLQGEQGKAIRFPVLDAQGHTGTPDPAIGAGEGR